MVSLRENVPTDSLHVSVDGNHLKAHVDHASPLVENEGGSRYSVPRALVHNVVGMARDVLTVVRGRQGDHACKLDCEWVAPETGATPRVVPLLDPKTSAWGVQLDARVAGRLDEARLQSALDALAGVRGAGEKCLDGRRLRGPRGARCRAPAAARAGLPLTVLPPFASSWRITPVATCSCSTSTTRRWTASARCACSIASRAPTPATAGADAALDFLACADLPVQPAPPPASRLVRLAAESGRARARRAVQAPAAG